MIDRALTKIPTWALAAFIVVLVPSCTGFVYWADMRNIRDATKFCRPQAEVEAEFKRLEERKTITATSKAARGVIEITVDYFDWKGFTTERSAEMMYAAYCATAYTDGYTTIRIVGTHGGELGAIVNGTWVR